MNDKQYDNFKGCSSNQCGASLERTLYKRCGLNEKETNDAIAKQNELKLTAVEYIKKKLGY